MSLSLGSWFGVTVELHWTWLFLLAFAIMVGAGPVFIGIFTIVLLHEYGHCIAAQRCSAKVGNIVLYPIGGVAFIEAPSDPWKEFVIAISGPLVNVALVPILYLVQHLYQPMTSIYFANLLILIFNLIPAFPMDGGRILRSYLSHSYRDHLYATKLATTVSKFCCVMFFVVGLYFGLIMMSVVGVLVFLAANGEIEAVAKEQQQLEVKG